MKEKKIEIYIAGFQIHPNCSFESLSTALTTELLKFLGIGAESIIIITVALYYSYIDRDNS